MGSCGMVPLRCQISAAKQLHLLPLLVLLLDCFALTQVVDQTALRYGFLRFLSQMRKIDNAHADLLVGGFQFLVVQLSNQLLWTVEVELLIVLIQHRELSQLLAEGGLLLVLTATVVVVCTYSVLSATI